MRTETGDQIIKQLMATAQDKALPEPVRMEALQKIRRAALRDISQTVEDALR